MSNNRFNQTLTSFLFSNAAVPFTNQLQRLKYFWSSLEKWYLWRLMVAPGRFVDRDRNTVKYISHTVWKNTLWAETVVSSDNEQNSHSFTPCFSSADLWSTCWTDIFFYIHLLLQAVQRSALSPVFETQQNVLTLNLLRDIFLHYKGRYLWSPEPNWETNEFPTRWKRKHILILICEDTHTDSKCRFNHPMLQAMNYISIHTLELDKVYIV